MNASGRRPARLRPVFLVAVILMMIALVVLVRLARGRIERLNADHETARQAEANAAIRRVLDDQVEAWNRGDLEGFMVGYWNSPDLRFSSGKVNKRGWQATLERYRTDYQAEGKEMGQLTFRDVEVELLGPGSALVRGRWQLVRRKDPAFAASTVGLLGSSPEQGPLLAATALTPGRAELLGGLFTLLVKKLPEGWRIVSDHTSA